MKIGISGATGFVGRRLVEKFTADGSQVLKLSRDLALATPLDAVVHLAGEPVSQRWSGGVKQRIRDSRILGTRKLVDGMRNLAIRPGVLVCASAVGFYGDRGEEELNESSGPGRGFLADVCRDWEREADGAAELGVRVVKIRIGLVLGPDGGALGKMLLAFRWGLGGRLGTGNQWMSWIHLDDLVSMIHFAVFSELASGPWNGVAPNPVTNAAFTKELAAAVNRPAFFAVPEFALRLAAGEMAQILLASQKCVPAAAEAAGFQFRYPELGAALRNVVT